MTKKATKSKGAPVGAKPEKESRTNWLTGLILGLLAVILYVNTLGHGFVLDDVLVITKNKFTTQGLSGWSKIFSTDTFFGYYQIEGKETMITGGRYRPLSLAFFAFIYQIFGAKPFVFHLFNVLFYALTSVLLYSTLQTVLHRDEKPRINSVAFFTTLFFVVHPIHTEVVNNIKCLDEIFSLLLSVLTLKLVLKSVDSGEFRWARWAGLSFLGACFSKENALTFLVVIPLVLYFFRSGTSRSKTQPGLFSLMTPAILSAFVFIVIRGSVLHWQFGAEANVLINNPFIKWDGAKWIPFSFGERSAAIIYSLGEYLRLLFFPYTLTHDYYPRQIGIVQWSDWQVWASAVAGLAIVFLGIKGYKNKGTVSFAVLYYIATISIVSNVFFPIGTNLSERFIFMPSVGFLLIISYLILKINNDNLKFGLVAVLSLLYSVKTFTRSQNWKDNLTLASTDIAVSGNSAKLNNSYAAQLCEKGLNTQSAAEKTALTNQAIAYYDKAISINPNYIEAFFGKGSAYFIQQNYEGALANYRAAEKIDPEYPNLQTNLTLALREAAKSLLQKQTNIPQAVLYLEEAQKRYPNDPEINGLLQQYRK